ncbi:MAG TPA: DNA translocase FtsK [Anaerolineales bacterium]|nr:DNA translocase FtsK [Anaerolineales bacterium]
MALAVSRDYLNFQSDRIERVLASHRVPVRVHGGTVSPRWIRFHLTPAIGAKIATVRNLSEELALALGAADVRVARDGETLALEVPRADAEPVRLLPMLRGMGNIPTLTACAGLAEDGRPLMLKLNSPDVAHILVAGATGSGKTELIRSIVLSLAITNRQSKVQFALIDPKRRGLRGLGVMPHCLAPVAEDPRAATTLLERLVGEMERRDREGIDTPHIVVAVDELADLMMVGGKPVEIALVRLAQRGREAGIHLVAGVQKPSAAVIGGMLKANFPVRLVGRVGSAEDARVAAGVSATGAERLLGRGDFMAVAAGQTVRFQAAWVPPVDWDMALRRL